MKQPFLYVAYAFLNTLFICADSEDIWTSFRPGSGYGNRNEFVIEEAVSDENFVLGKDVYSWKSIKHGKYAFAVGLMPSGLTIIKAGVGANKNRFNVNHTVHDLQQKPMDITLHGCWNKTIRKTELILAVAVFNRTYNIDWYKIHDNLNMEKIWTWPICKKLYQIEFYKHKLLHKLLVISQDVANHTYADTYEFSLQEKQFWLTQPIALANPTKSSAVSTSGPNYYLAIPQKTLNSVLIFKYSGDHFVSHKNITCKNADFVASFKVSFKSYLAIAGDDGGIFEFYKNTLRKIEVEGSTLEGVKFWFPIPVSNFREEVVLFIQRSVETESHNTWHLEAVLHNENQFTLLEEFHCKFHGEEMAGLRCMADEDRENGVIGLTTLSVGDTLGLLVPRAGDAPSGLLMLRTGMKSLSSKVNDEIKKIDATKVKLEHLLEKRKKAINDSKMVRSSRSAAFKSPEAASQGAEWLTPEQEEIEELEFRAEILKHNIGEMKMEFNEFMEERQKNRFDTVVFNGIVKVEGNGNFGKIFARDISMQNTYKVLNYVAKPGNIDNPISSKRFGNLRVEHLYFENVNGIPADNLVFSEKDYLNIKGDVVFKSPVAVEAEILSTSGKVNEVILDREIVTTERDHDGILLFENLKVEDSVQINFINRMPLHSNYLDRMSPVSDLTNLNVVGLNSIQIPVDIRAEFVNGEKFDNFLKSIVMKNISTKISQDVSIKGNVNVTDIASVRYLNGNKFPENYLSVNPEADHSQISGIKRFNNAITVDTIVARSLNGINPEYLVTLSTRQTIPATVHFENIEITESLFIDDNKIEDEHLATFEPSPTLEETKILYSDLSFQSLEIDGTLTVIQDFNESNFKALLNSIVYKDDPVTKVNSVKEFSQGISVPNNLDIKYNTINNISLESFVLKDTHGPLQIKTLKGRANFKNVYLSGLFDEVNVTKLDKDTIRTFGEQYLSAHLHFDDLIIDKLFINKTLNNIPIQDYLFIDGNRTFEGDVEFDNVVAQTVLVGGNTKITLKNFDIKSFDKRVLRKSENQRVVANYTIARAYAKKLNATEINGIALEDLSPNKITAKQLVELAKSGNLKVKDLYVKGSVQIDNINGVASEALLGSSSWKTKFNNENISLILKANARFGHVNVNTLDNVEFDTFAKELVFKNETNIHFRKNVIFANGITFTNNINTKMINGVPLQDILTKSPTALNISGDLYINSDVTIEKINGYPLQTLGTKLEILDKTLKLKSDIDFQNGLEMEELWIGGRVNEINASDVLEHAVFVDKKAVFKEEVIFQRPVEVYSNFGVKETVDGVNLPALMELVVLKSKDGVIPSTVVFAKPVVVKNSIEVFGNMYTKYLDGCDVEMWKKDALLLNQGLLKGSFTFEDVNIQENLYTEFVNKYNIHHIIPLRTEQQISQFLQFGEISSYHSITVNNSVNNRNLQTEFENTLLSEFTQTLDHDVEFNEEVFATSVEATATVNGLVLTNIVTTYTDQVLNGTYNFSKEVFIKGNLQINGTCNGINLTDWFKNSLKKQSKLQQIVDGQLTMYGDLRFVENVEGDGRINGLELLSAVEDLEKKKAAKYNIEKDVMSQYTKACKDVNHILRESKRQMHTFKYFELLQRTEFVMPIQSSHHFEHDNKNYLLISEKNNCLSHLFTWNTNQFVFKTSVESGLVAQVVTVKIRDLVFLVTRSISKTVGCSIGDTNIWLFKDETLKHLKLLKPSTLLQDSRRPGAFYSIEYDAVVEYRITDFGNKIQKYRKWSISVNANLIFVPRGLNTGLALINNNELVKLLQNEPDDMSSANLKGTINGNIASNSSNLPFNAGNGMVVLNVGIPGKTRKLLAVATQEKSSIHKGLDLIKVYEDLNSKRLFQNIPSYKPSSLASIELENGETFLVFFEDKTMVQVYEYKGIEGFKRRTSFKFHGNKLFVVYLGTGENKRTIIGVIDDNVISLLDTVMMGNKLETPELDCEL